VETGSVYVHCDVTAVFPWLTHALFSTGARRQPMRLMDALPEAVALLDRDVLRRRPALLRTIDWSLSEAKSKSATLSRPGPTVR
jgi:deoxyhypusine synthase